MKLIHFQYTTAEWAAVDATTGRLDDRRLAAELKPDGTKVIKMGDGVSRWADLPVLNQAELDAMADAIADIEAQLGSFSEEYPEVPDGSRVILLTPGASKTYVSLKNLVTTPVIRLTSVDDLNAMGADDEIDNIILIAGEDFLDYLTAINGWASDVQNKVLAIYSDREEDDTTPIGASAFEKSENAADVQTVINWNWNNINDFSNGADPSPATGTTAYELVRDGEVSYIITTPDKYMAQAGNDDGGFGTTFNTMLNKLVDNLVLRCGVTAFMGYLTPGDVVNALDSAETEKPLAAAQGKALNDGKVDKSVTAGGSSVTVTNDGAKFKAVSNYADGSQDILTLQQGESGLFLKDDALGSETVFYGLPGQATMERKKYDAAGNYISQQVNLLDGATRPNFDFKRNSLAISYGASGDDNYIALTKVPGAASVAHTDAAFAAWLHTNGYTTGTGAFPLAAGSHWLEGTERPVSGIYSPDGTVLNVAIDGGGGAADVSGLTYAAGGNVDQNHDFAFMDDIEAEASARESAVTTLQGNIDTEAGARAAADGNLSQLQTTAKTSLVAAINEANSKAVSAKHLAGSLYYMASTLEDRDAITGMGDLWTCAVNETATTYYYDAVDGPQWKALPAAWAKLNKFVRTTGDRDALTPAQGETCGVLADASVWVYDGAAWVAGEAPTDEVGDEYEIGSFYGEWNGSTFAGNATATLTLTAAGWSWAVSESTPIDNETLVLDGGVMTLSETVKESLEKADASATQAALTAEVSRAQTAEATKVDKLTTTGRSVYGHNGSTQGEIPVRDTLDPANGNDLPTIAAVLTGAQPMVTVEPTETLGAALTAAVGLLPSQGGVVLLKPGAYTLEAATTISKSGVTIMGPGAVVTFAALLTMSGAYAVLRDFTMIKTRTGGSAISLTGTRPTVDGVIFTGEQTDYFFIVSTATYTMFRNCIGTAINPTATVSAQAGIINANADGCTVKNCRLAVSSMDQAGSDYCLIRLGGYYSAAIGNELVISAGAGSARPVGIYLGGTTCRAIDNNINFTYTGASDLLGIYGPIDHGRVTNNFIRLAGASTGNKIGFYCTGYGQGIIANNTMTIEGSAANNIGYYFSATGSSLTAIIHSNITRIMATATDYNCMFAHFGGNTGHFRATDNGFLNTGACARCWFFMFATSLNVTRATVRGNSMYCSINPTSECKFWFMDTGTLSDGHFINNAFTGLTTTPVWFISAICTRCRIEGNNLDDYTSGSCYLFDSGSSASSLVVIGNYLSNGFNAVRKSSTAYTITTNSASSAYANNILQWGNYNDSV